MNRPKTGRIKLTNTLSGKRIVNTRAIHQAEKLDHLLLEHGAIPLSYPCIEIVPPEDKTQLDTALKSLADYDWLILTSSNSIYTLANRLSELDLMPDWLQLKIAVVGSSTAKAVEKHFNIVADFIPDEYVAEALADNLPISTGTKILLPQSEIARSVLTEKLVRRGGIVDAITAYQTVLGQSGVDLPAMIATNEVDAVTFTSSSTVENFVKRLDAVPEILAVCIGRITAETAHDLGFTEIIMPQIYTLAEMVKSLVQYFDKNLKLENP